MSVTVEDLGDVPVLYPHFGAKVVLARAPRNVYAVRPDRSPVLQEPRPFASNVLVDPVPNYGVILRAMHSTPITIGMLAKRSSVGVETVRFYEREGLLPKPARTSSGYRSYSEEAIERVRFIRRAKELGFTLGEIGDLLALKVSHGRSCESVRQRALSKVADIDSKISDLRRMRRALHTVAQRCSGHEGMDNCTILGALSRGAAIPVFAPSNDRVSHTNQRRV